jgi:uncharacterized iron-regulated protein
MPWKSNYGRNHPLTGRIWDTAGGQYIDRDSLFSQLAGMDFVLLGEKHDNPDHHLLQAAVIRALLARGRRPAIGFEMFTIDQAAAIANHLASAPNDAAGIASAVNWHQSGWPDWAMYQPIAEAALEARLAIVATNLPPTTIKKMRRNGVAGLDPRARRELGLDQPLSERMFAVMAADIRASHCGFGSEESVKAMVDVQRARDAQMAQSLTAAGKIDGAVLVAGAGHVRSDYGVPAVLRVTTVNKRTASVAFLEVAEGKLEPRHYGASNDGRLPFDYVWFTPRVDNEDPCEKFRSRFRRLEKAP